MRNIEHLYRTDEDFAELAQWYRATKSYTNDKHNAHEWLMRDPEAEAREGEPIPAGYMPLPLDRDGRPWIRPYDEDFICPFGERYVIRDLYVDEHGEWRLRPRWHQLSFKADECRHVDGE